MNDAGAAIIEFVAVTSLLLLTILVVVQMSALVTLRVLVYRAADSAARVAAVEGAGAPHVAEVARATLERRVVAGDVRVNAVDRGPEVDVTVTVESPAPLVVVGTLTATATRTDERDIVP